MCSLILNNIDCWIKYVQICIYKYIFWGAPCCRLARRACRIVAQLLSCLRSCGQWSIDIIDVIFVDVSKRSPQFPERNFTANFPLAQTLKSKMLPSSSGWLRACSILQESWKHGQNHDSLLKVVLEGSKKIPCLSFLVDICELVWSYLNLTVSHRRWETHKVVQVFGSQIWTCHPLTDQ